jgi:uncharacterized protein (DUF1697 family)
MKVRYVAFLRAINTGNRRIKMAGLRALYEDLGYSDVATYIASGNVIFDAPSPPLPAELELGFAERFGFTSEVFLRSGEEIRSIVVAVPWRGDDVVVEVSFLEREPGVAEARSLEATAVAPEELVVAGREVFFLRGRGRGEPTTHKESTSMDLLNMRMTRRGMATVDQIHARFLLPGM